MFHTMDFVMGVENALPVDTCKSLINKFEAKSDLLVTRDNDYQKFDELNLNQTEGFEDDLRVLQNSARFCLSHYKKELKTKYFPGAYVLEEFRMKKYDPDKDHEFDWHVDVGDYASARRFMVCFFYLNTVEEGGYTAFDYAEDDQKAILAEPIEGTAVLFPPFWMFVHKGMKPFSGPKYIVSTYAHFMD